ncbi:HD domain-containing protein [bacterium]|nr:HD domain-containing protein [bacterium]MBU4361311.1 HD domain-containing protein [bacterium]MBU4601622.1 HD domain-containing protein [bacterium]
MTGVFYYTGGVLWIGAIFYVFTILYVSLLSAPKEGLIITFMAITLFSLIVFLEYLGYIPHKEIIKFTPYLYKDIQYIIGTILVISLVFIFIFLTGKDFAQMLKQKNDELAQTKKKLEELSNKLEDKVKLQTDELKKSKDRLSILYQISRSISSTLELNNILKVILDFSVKISGANRGSVMLLDEKKNIFFIKAAYNLSEKIIREVTFAKDENTIGWVVKNKKSLYIKDLKKDKRFSIKAEIDYKLKQLLMVPIIIEGEVKGVINLDNNTSFTTDTINLLKSFSEQAAVAINNARLYQKIQDSYFEIVKALAQAIEAKDPYTHGHSERVMKYTVLIAQKLELQEGEKESLRYAAILHDIGKIGVRGTVLNNPNGLTGEEYDEIKKHPLIGEGIIKPIELLQPIRPLIRHHHEWHNGKGYPDGLSGENIPLGARILAVADAYDAMKSDRPYRKALTEEAAIQEFKRGSGSQFEPKLVEIFLKILKQNLSEDSPLTN